ncbi:MAG: glycerol-3-phosphate ABC transporter ATP-binding protein, partial [bacterium]
QVEAMTLGDRIVIMKDAEIQQVDTPINIYDYPVNKFVGSFIGSPAMNFITGSLIKNNGSVEFIFEDKSNKVVIPEKYHEKIKKHIDEEVYFGIRPEAILDAHYHEFSQEKKSRYSPITGKVEVIERLGNEMVVYLRAGKQIVIFKEDAHYKTETDTKMEVLLDLERLHIFDKKNEINLTLQGA